LTALLMVGALAACRGNERSDTASNDRAVSRTAQKQEAKMARLNYVELPVRDIGASKTFYEQAFGWSLTEFAPTYAATVTGDTDIGLDADAAEAPKAPLPVIEVQNLEAALSAVEAAGGKIVRPIFAFPGGRRFQFLDPSGNEIAVSQPS
jgi:predicted enzyme related to lactoylglutathione lyase